MKYEVHDGPNQYGRRAGTLGLALHMTEGNGGDGDLAYLLRNPARGVSANFFAHEDGTIHQLMPLTEASGSMNPNDRARKGKGYFGSEHIVAVLGALYVNPNAYSISIEIGGKRAAGPNARQVAACIRWGLDMRDRFPTLRGAYGHADQTDTKGCPGSTAGMRAIFEGIGGHGLFREDDVTPIEITDRVPALVNASVGRDVFDLDGKTKLTELAAGVTDRYSPYAAGEFRSIYVETRGILRIALIKPSGPVKPIPAPAEPDCKAEVAAAVAADRRKAKIVYS